jgi:hypothetical protein
MGQCSSDAILATGFDFCSSLSLSPAWRFQRGS